MSIYEEFRLPIIDLVSRASEIPNLKAIILFGSAITSDISKKSDIDILLITSCEHNPEINEESDIAHKITSEISKKYNLTHSFSIAFYNINHKEEIDSDFLWEISGNGMVIWAKPEYLFTKIIKENLSPKLLVKYSLEKLKDKDKRALLRGLYESKKKLIDIEKEKIAPGVILISAHKFIKLKELFEKYKLVSYSVKKIWID